jgi:hypothetical protein
VGAEDLLSEVKEAEARGWTTHHCLVTRIECVELLPHSPYVPSWRAQGKIYVNPIAIF